MDKIAEDIILNKYVYPSNIVLKIYKLIKFIIRKILNTTELVRVCRNDKWREARLACRIDQVIFYSDKLKDERIQLLKGTKEQINEAYNKILEKKRFPDDASHNSIEAKILLNCLLRIKETYEICHVLESRAALSYDSNNPDHETKLLKLWSLLNPEEELTSRKSEQWQTIGFQGLDPATDFRGMGILGLEQLLYFSTNYNDTARHILSCSHHTYSWYSFAITGINLTSLALDLLRKRHIQFYLLSHESTVETFNEFYCYLFTSFNNFWFSQPQPVTVMNFNEVFKIFKKQIISELVNQKPIIINTEKKKY